MRGMDELQWLLSTSLSKAGGMRESQREADAKVREERW